MMGSQATPAESAGDEKLKQWLEIQAKARKMEIAQFVQQCNVGEYL
jgi:hypothetical protein